MKKKALRVIEVLIVVAIILIPVLMFAKTIITENKVKQWDAVPATIDRIEEVNENSINKRKRKYIYVSYEYEGVLYSEVLLQGTGATMRSGDQYIVKVNPENPKQAATEKGKINIGAEGIFVIFFALVFIVVIVQSFVEAAKNKKTEDKSDN